MYRSSWTDLEGVNPFPILEVVHEVHGVQRKLDGEGDAGATGAGSALRRNQRPRGVCRGYVGGRATG